MQKEKSYFKLKKKQERENIFEVKYQDKKL